MDCISAGSTCKEGEAFPAVSGAGNVQVGSWVLEDWEVAVKSYDGVAWGSSGTAKSLDGDEDMLNLIGWGERV